VTREKSALPSSCSTARSVPGRRKAKARSTPGSRARLDFGFDRLEGQGLNAARSRIRCSGAVLDLIESSREHGPVGGPKPGRRLAEIPATPILITIAGRLGGATGSQKR